MATTIRRTVSGMTVALFLLTTACAATPTATPSAAPSVGNSAPIASVDITGLHDSDGEALPAGEPTTINCTVNGKGQARWRATFADGTTSRVEVQLPPREEGRSVWQTVPFGPGIVMAIVPGEVENLDVLADVPNDEGYYSIASGSLRAVDSTCLVIRYDVADDAAKVQGLVWRAADGPFRRDTGAVVPSVDAAVGDERVTVYGDRTLDLFGVVTSSGSAISYRPGKSTDPFPCVLFSTDRLDNGRWQTLFVGLLPQGATAAKMTFLPSASKPGLQSLTADSGDVFVVADAQTRAERGEVFTAFSYADQNGTRVTPRWG